MVTRQVSSALLGCRKKVFESARHMWCLVATHLSSCHGMMMLLGQQLGDALPEDLLRAGKEIG